MINIILLGASVVGIIVLLFTMYQRSKLKTVIVEEEDFDTIDKVLEAVKLEMVELVKDNYTLGLSDAEFNAMYHRKAKINKALRDCVHGIDQAKATVIELIRGFIVEHVPAERITELLGLTDGVEPSDHVKFEILMYVYKNRKSYKYGKEALPKWIEKNGFDNERQLDDSTNPMDKAFYITVDDLHMSYEEENIVLSQEEQAEVLAILVYQLYKGFGIVDTLREMDINGFNIGASGSILTNVTKQREGMLQANTSVWLFYNGKYIHLRFMDFGNEDEAKRIIQLICRYNNPGPLTAKRGYLVNTMYDKSRVLALRPPASEYWAVFVRKFNLSDMSPEALIVKSYTHKGEVPIKLMEYLIRGQITCAVTGQQGTGKTTLMSSLVRYIDPKLTVRVLEMAPELYLRELYTNRNIESVQETQTVSAAELQDALKKSDANVSIVGEVATDAIAARMIQMGQVASLFTIFSHHAITARDLVFALRNSLVNAGGFSNMDTAERQVTDVVKIDIHLGKTANGVRFIERITEIVPLAEGIPYPDIDENDVDLSRVKLEREYYSRVTDRVSFYTHDLLRYDIDTNTYYVCDRMSPQLEAKLRGTLDISVREQYDKFIWSLWGRRKTTDGKYDTENPDDVANSIPKYMDCPKEQAGDFLEPAYAPGFEAVSTQVKTADGVVTMYDPDVLEAARLHDNVVDDNVELGDFQFFDGEGVV